MNDTSMTRKTDPKYDDDLVNKRYVDNKIKNIPNEILDEKNANLLTIANGTRSGNGLYLNASNGKIEITGTWSGSELTRSFSIVSTTLEPGTYTLLSNSDGASDYPYLVLFSGNTRIVRLAGSSHYATFTLTENTRITSLRVYINSSSASGVTIYPQIIKGIVPLKYERSIKSNFQMDLLFSQNVSTDTSYVINGNFRDYICLIFIQRHSYGDIPCFIPTERFIDDPAINITGTQDANSAVQIFQQIAYTNDSSFTCIKSGYRQYNSNSWSDNPYGLTIYGIKGG